MKGYFASGCPFLPYAHSGSISSWAFSPLLIVKRASSHWKQNKDKHKTKVLKHFFLKKKYILDAFFTLFLWRPVHYHIIWARLSTPRCTLGQFHSFHVRKHLPWTPQLGFTLLHCTAPTEMMRSTCLLQRKHPVSEHIYHEVDWCLFKADS